MRPFQIRKMQQLDLVITKTVLSSNLSNELVRGLRSYKNGISGVNISDLLLKRWKDDLRPIFSLRLDTQDGNDEPQYSWAQMRKRVTRTSS